MATTRPELGNLDLIWQKNFISMYSKADKHFVAGLGSWLGC